VTADAVRIVRRTWLGAAFAALATGLAVAVAPPAPLSAVGGPAVESAQAGSCAYASGKPGEISRGQARNAVVCLINNRRAERGKGRLGSQSGLRKAASRHSRRMAKRNCFAHQCPGEKDLTKRVHGTSYLPCNCSWGLGENIAWGRKGEGTPKRIVKAWMRSSSHKRIMLDGTYKHIGIGAVWGSPTGSGGGVGTYTATFGYKR
jgi:uncharacterized protein YkwD